MTLTRELQEQVVLPIILKTCCKTAKLFRLNAQDGWGYVYCKVLSRLESIEQLRKPVAHFLRRTASREAYRFFRGKSKWKHHQKED